MWYGARNQTPTVGALMHIGFRKLLLLLAVTTLCLFCLSLMLPSNILSTNGAAPFLLLELLNDDTDIAQTILIELRIPRATLALFVGASLGLAGAAMQGLLRKSRWLNQAWSVFQEAQPGRHSGLLHRACNHRTPRTAAGRYCRH